MYFLCKCICSLNIGHSNFKLCMAHRPLEVTGQCFMWPCFKVRVYFLVNESPLSHWMKQLQTLQVQRSHDTGQSFV